VKSIGSFALKSLIFTGNTTDFLFEE